MKEYELWLILMDISNYEKVKLIEKYNNVSIENYFRKNHIVITGKKIINMCK